MTPICPNCGQWQHPREGGRDCLYECVARGFAPVERMPAADALSDAETLRLFMVDGRHFCDLGTRRGWWGPAFKASVHAARAAFRAVPGLRS